jgi:O-methyltransferase
MIKKAIKTVLEKFGYSVVKRIEYEDDFWSIYLGCKPFTMTSVERMHSLHSAVEYVLANSIPGDFVECGVWRGGSSMMMAKTLLKSKVTDRHIYLYDTFEGMPMPTPKDVDHRGNPAEKIMFEKNSLADKMNSVWCLADLKDVKTNLSSTLYPEEKLHFVEGKVEMTIPRTVPEKIALLRLDTDWYESTYHELVHLYPLLERAGVLILDDYGHWQGAKEAVDRYFIEKKIPIFLNRIDDTGRIVIKVF